MGLESGEFSGFSTRFAYGCFFSVNWKKDNNLSFSIQIGFFVVDKFLQKDQTFCSYIKKIRTFFQNCFFKLIKIRFRFCAMGFLCKKRQIFRGAFILSKSLGNWLNHKSNSIFLFFMFQKQKYSCIFLCMTKSINFVEKKTNFKIIWKLSKKVFFASRVFLLLI